MEDIQRMRRAGIVADLRPAWLRQPVPGHVDNPRTSAPLDRQGAASGRAHHPPAGHWYASAGDRAIEARARSAGPPPCPDDDRLGHRTPELPLSLFPLIHPLRPLEHLAGLAAVGGADDAFLLHHVQDAGGASVTEPQAALESGSGSLPYHCSSWSLPNASQGMLRSRRTYTPSARSAGSPGSKVSEFSLHPGHLAVQFRCPRAIGGKWITCRVARYGNQWIGRHKKACGKAGAREMWGLDRSYRGAC